MTARGLLIAIGNPLRRDDGAAHRVLDLLAKDCGWDRRPCFQLTPELAQEIAPYDTVVFVDADAEARDFECQPVGCPAGQVPLSHAAPPADLVAMARALFEFRGSAWLARIPAYDFSHGEGLSAQAEAAVHHCVRRLREL